MFPWSCDQILCSIHLLIQDVFTVTSCDKYSLGTQPWLYYAVSNWAGETAGIVYIKSFLYSLSQYYIKSTWDDFLLHQRFAITFFLLGFETLVHLHVCSIPTPLNIYGLSPHLCISNGLPPHPCISNGISPHPCISNDIYPHTLVYLMVYPHTLVYLMVYPHTLIYNGISPHPCISNGIFPHPCISNGLSPYPCISNGLPPHPCISNGLPPHHYISNGIPPHPCISNGISPHPCISNGISPHPYKSNGLPHTLTNLMVYPHTLGPSHTSNGLSLTNWWKYEFGYCYILLHVLC